MLFWVVYEAPFRIFWTRSFTICFILNDIFSLVCNGGLLKLAMEALETSPSDPDHRHSSNLLRRLLRKHRGLVRHERSGNHNKYKSLKADEFLMYTYYQLHLKKSKFNVLNDQTFSRFFLFTTFQLNCLMSLQLPFALIPAIAFSSNPRLMGEFANGETIVLFTCSPERKTVTCLMHDSDFTGRFCYLWNNYHIIITVFWAIICVRMRESYKRFVKTWIRFANP